MSAEKEYPVYVKTLKGANKEVRVKANDTVADLKKKVETALSSSVLRLLYRNKELADPAKTLSDLKIEQESLVVAILPTEKPSHYFFALDESGSMSGGRWQALIDSFVEFVDKQQSSVEKAKSDVAIQDAVSVFFHQTHTRVASCKTESGEIVPFLDIPLSSLKSDSLVNDFRSGGNNFDHALTFIEPHLHRVAQDYTPVLLFMTDGGDCGDASPYGYGDDFRKRSYDHMAKIKKDIPDLRVYVTVVFTTSAQDIEGAKRLCAAAGMDVSTNYNFIEDDGTASHSFGAASHSFGGYAIPCASTSYASPALSSVPFSFASASPSPFPSASISSYGPAYSAAIPSPSPSSAPPSHYSSVSASSAQRKMASHWDYVYNSNSVQQCAFSEPPKEE